jgi:hypothetical protein
VCPDLSVDLSDLMGIRSSQMFVPASLGKTYSPLAHFILYQLKGLSHEMDLAFHDMYEPSQSTFINTQFYSFGN